MTENWSPETEIHGNEKICVRKVRFPPARYSLPLGHDNLLNLYQSQMFSMQKVTRLSGKQRSSETAWYTLCITLERSHRQRLLHKQKKARMGLSVEVARFLRVMGAYK